MILLSCILLLGESHFVYAVKSPTGIASLFSPKRFAFLRRRDDSPFSNERNTMSTRSGVRYRGGADADPAAGGDGNSDESQNAPTPNTSEATESSQPTQDTAVSTAQATAPPTTATTSDTTAAASENDKKSFSWRDARRTLFPIHGKDEVHKFLLIGSIKFFIIMALTLTRDTKDTLIVTQCGAEAIAFLKVSSSGNKCRVRGMRQRIFAFFGGYETAACAVFSMESNDVGNFVFLVR